MPGVSARPRSPRGSEQTSLDLDVSAGRTPVPASKRKRRSLYGRSHLAQRRALIAAARLSSRPTLCPFCSLPIDLEDDAQIHADHFPPLATVGDDVSQTVLRLSHAACNLAPENKPTQRAASSVAVTGESVSTLPVAQVGVPWSDPVWRVPWLSGLRRIPADASAPRFMTIPHPSAVGSYRARFERWYAARHPHEPLRWWQRLVAARALEHDAAGRLCWRTIVGPLTPRQQGKSTVLTELMAWRTEQVGLFGPRPQHCVITSYNVTQASGVHARSRVAALAWPDLYRVGLSRGAEVIEERATGATYAVKALQATYGSSLVAAFVDEAWAIPQAPVSEGIVPTLLRAESSQLFLTSTAHRLCTPLLLDRRQAAIASLQHPTDTLVLEWSAPADAALDDLDALRGCWPWHTEATIAAAMQALTDALTVELVDPNEPDPVQSWREQYRNQFPERATVRRLGAELATDEELAAATELAASAHLKDSSAMRFVAMDDCAGRGASVVWVYPTSGGGWWLHAEPFVSWEAARDAVAEAARSADADGTGGPFRLLVDPAIAGARLFATVGLAAESVSASALRLGIPATMQAFQARRVALSPPSAEWVSVVLGQARVREAGSASGFTRDTDTSVLVRPLVWAMGAAVAHGALEG